MGKSPFEPDTDGYFLPQSVSAIFAAGNQAHVPLLAGWNRDEDSGGRSEASGTRYRGGPASYGS